ncbi:MAG: hypothetical protein JXB38_03845 [Anaerolineales bacterium]|nr:hypothetical protein [Anaerolineales bacterium]
MIKRHLLRHWLLLLVFCLQFGLPARSMAAPAVQGTTPEERAQAMLDSLTPEERVGQLFLVTFEGTDVSEETELYDLIINGHIGGVVLQAENNNFVAAPDTVSAALALNQELQNIEWRSSWEEQTIPNTTQQFNPAFIPLLIGISQEGGGYPYDQILNGLTKLPNAMTLGATWDPNLSQRAGEILGRELSLLGFNMLFGPSMDVLENPQPENLGDVGVSSFGGDPYWVGRMGSAFVSGLHTGSNDELLVIAKHFPGQGGSNRPFDQEIPTVNKSLEQLSRIELPPFYAVTGNATTPEATVDGLLLSHIRYQGFQGNIRATTRPVSFDPQAFGELMALDPLANWRTAGGLIVSDQLGSRAVRRFYDASEEIFNAPAVARDAFLAGNDLLYLSNFIASDDEDSYTTILRTLEFFAQKYREDVAFAQRVDESVLRILTHKYTIYPNFLISQVEPNENDLEAIQPDTQFAFEVGRKAVTLISPSAQELDAVMPSPPGLLDQVVIITDTNIQEQCQTCPESEDIAVDALSQAILRLYGPEGGGQVLRGNLFPFTFDDLVEMMDDTSGNFNALLSNMRRAEWVIFLTQNLRDDSPSSFGLRRLLSERPDLLRGKQVVVFAMNAPYYLDATEHSKITAFYALYSKEPQFIELAARLLFKEITAPGASPVSISAVGYDLIDVTSPDPNRPFSLELSLEPGNGATVQPTAQADVGSGPTPTIDPLGPTATPEPPLELRVGDQVYFQTGVILDYNGHSVPDNTPVQFILTTNQEGATIQREVTANTVNGVARTNFVLEIPGTLNVRAVSGVPEAVSPILQYDIASDGSEPIVITQTPGATVEPTIEPSPTIAITPMIEAALHEETTFGDWILLLLITAFISLFAYQAGALSGQVRWGIRWGLLALIGGLATNVYMALSLPGTRDLLLNSGLWGIVLLTVGGTIVGWAAGWAWQQSTKKK